jgi:uncharacterized protein YggE
MKAGITVSARGRVVAPPDRAVFILGASLAAETVAAAMAEVSSRVERLLEVLAGYGVEASRVQTHELSIWPEHDREGARIGFRVRNLVRVVIDDLPRVGEVVAGAIDALGDAAEVQGLRLVLEDSQQAMAEARRRAWASARAQAEELAAAAGLRLGAPISIIETDASPSPVAKAMAWSEAAPIEPGSNTVEVSLTVRFALAG